jgi:endogenous inhibitor of DNA gyrase (YacG/DUF329 family)
MMKPSKVKCPVCHKRGAWLAGGFGPFCSHRCKLIDLGKWLGGEHAIAEPLRPEHFEQYADLPAGQHLDLPEAREKSR